MDRYSLIVVADETAPIRRFDILKSVVHRSLWGLGLLAALLLIGLVDYVGLRIEQPEVILLRAEADAQRERLELFETTLTQVTAKLDAVKELERKVRIIANLPGAAATGGGEIAEVTIPDGVENAVEEVETEAAESIEAEHVPVQKLDDSAKVDLPPAQRVGGLRDEAQRLGLVADVRGVSLKQLVDALEKKHRRLASSPAIWPTKGWLTSAYGYRMSPFTAKRTFHSGIDVAGRLGTSVVAPARGKVTFSGRRGPLGNTVILDHGYGVRTFFGHNDEIFVKRGDEVERGWKIATLGNSGRSTGPHLHYVVEVNGKTRNPLDYIFD